jgi:phospholipase C
VQGSTQLSVQTSGAGGGTINSTPAGINCGQACSASFASGTQITLTATASASSSFAGWTGGGCSGSTPTCALTLSASQQVTASFNTIPNPAVLTVNAAGIGTGTIASNPAGINCGPTCSASFASGTQVMLTATAGANSTFAGWTAGGCSGGSPTCTLTVSASQQVTASFNAIPNLDVLTVNLAGTGTGTIASNPAGINCGPTCSASFASGTQVTLTATAGVNSTFAGWTGTGCSGTNPTCTLTLTASQQVIASFNTAAVVLTVSLTGAGAGTIASNPSGINCAPTCSASFASETQVTLTAIALENSSFAGWTGSCSGTNPTCTLTLGASQQVTASFSTTQSAPVLTEILAGTGTGTVSSNPAGINCAPTCSASFASGTQATLTATAGANSSFAGWTGGCSGSNPTCTLTLSASLQVTATFASTAAMLTVSLVGTGTGTVASNPSGVTCGPTCTASFADGTQVTLTETASASSSFSGWTGGCTGTSPTCALTMNTSEQVTATFGPVQNITLLNHIIFLAQENRSFDHYFGALRGYWAQNGYPDQSFDGLPQFNPSSGIAPLYGPPPTNPGCNPASPPPSDCVLDTNNLVTSYPLITQCIENPSPSWNESHMDWDSNDPMGELPAVLNGFVWSAGHDARDDTPPFYDVDGIRAMGYYDGSDLNYYYFMASNFATSDRWFHPVMTRTAPNREYLIAGTSQGYIYPLGTDNEDTALLTAPTIFQALQTAGITWKIYVDPTGSLCTGPPYDPACLLTLSYIQNFVWGQTIPSQYPLNIAPISQYFTDLQNGTLPQVAQIEPATDAGFDEHPSVSDAVPNDIQLGANYVSLLINGLMTSTSWADSAFILTYDEFGGLYDHVSPQPAVSPDGIKPVDFLPGDICTEATGPTCDFVYTGYRVPLIVVSPYAIKNFVSHNVADTTAILKLIETRFNVPALTNRDAAQIDMTEFFDFTNPAWMTPPSPPVQIISGACYLNQLP